MKVLKIFKNYLNSFKVSFIKLQNYFIQKSQKAKLSINLILIDEKKIKFILVVGYLFILGLNFLGYFYIVQLHELIYWVSGYDIRFHNIGFVQNFYSKESIEYKYWLSSVDYFHNPSSTLVSIPEFQVNSPGSNYIAFAQDPISQKYFIQYCPDLHYAQTHFFNFYDWEHGLLENYLTTNCYCHEICKIFFDILTQMAENNPEWLKNPEVPFQLTPCKTCQIET